jgi:hypothetical protein
MSTVAVFLDTVKAFHTIWHSVYDSYLSELKFSTGLIKLIASFLTYRKFKVLVDSEFSMPRGIAFLSTQYSSSVKVHVVKILTTVTFGTCFGKDYRYYNQY